MLIFVNGNAQGLAATHGILKAGELECVMSAQQAQDELLRRAQATLEQAQSQARQLLEHAQSQAQAMMQDAQEAIEAERERGYQEGMRQAVMEWHDRQARSAVEQSHALGTLHGKLAEIVTTAVERIVNTESRTALYERALKNVQSLTRGATKLTLRVSPPDYEHARNTIASLGDTHAAGLQVEVAPDPALKAGSCIFESDLGVLDASLETQLDGLRTAMSRAVRAAVAQADVEPEANEPGMHVAEAMQQLQGEQNSHYPAESAYAEGHEHGQPYMEHHAEHHEGSDDERHDEQHDEHGDEYGEQHVEDHACTP